MNTACIGCLRGLEHSDASYVDSAARLAKGFAGSALDRAWTNRGGETARHGLPRETQPFDHRRSISCYIEHRACGVISPLLQQHRPSNFRQELLALPRGRKTTFCWHGEPQHPKALGTGTWSGQPQPSVRAPVDLSFSKFAALQAPINRCPNPPSQSGRPGPMAASCFACPFISPIQFVGFALARPTSSRTGWAERPRLSFSW